MGGAPGVEGQLRPGRVERGQLAVNPRDGLRLPRVEGRRERVADPSEAATLIAALPEADRALWATAMYAGLRRGELLALAWSDLDLASGIIRVERSWDVKVGIVALKSKAGRRKVPVAAALRDHLLEHRLLTDRAEGFVFGDSASQPFDPTAVRRRANRTWRKAKLEQITLHECRHTFASLMIAAGVNAKALSTFMGHANISITLDRYGHLMPGSEEESAELLDGYLAAQRQHADKAARGAGEGLRAGFRAGLVGGRLRPNPRFWL